MFYNTFVYYHNMLLRIHPEVVEKVAETPDDRDRLRREAATLRAVAHPGVVRLVSASDDRLTLDRISGSAVSDSPAGRCDEVAAWGAALCTTVSDLHDIGCAHTAISGDHVILDGDGRPVLCGFGSARWARDQSEWSTLALADRNAVVSMLTEHLGDFYSKTPGALHLPSRQLNRLLKSRQRRRFRRSNTDLRSLARTLAALNSATAERIAGQPRSMPSKTRPQMVPPSRRIGAVAVALAVTLALGIGLFASTPARRASNRSEARQILTVVGPSGLVRLITSWSGPVSVLVGRWDCHYATAAVLQADTGQVWVFSGWPPPAHSEVGHLVARVAGAVSLSSVPRPLGCDTLMVETRSGSSIAATTATTATTR